MMWDAENGFLNGGIKDELLSARLNIANRLATLNPEAAAAMGPFRTHMRDPAQLKAVAERNKQELMSAPH